MAFVAGLGLAVLPAGCVHTADQDDAENPSRRPDALLARLTDEDPEVRFHARLALMAQGRGAVPTLVQALEGEDANGRYEAAAALSAMGPVPREEAVPALIKAAQAPKRPIQSMALEALASIGPTAKSAGPVLRRLLRDRTELGRLALIALARTGGAAAVPDLIQALRTPQTKYCGL
jgi:HEAT repeat protein